MRVLAILAHPDPQSLCHRIFQHCLQKLSENGHEIIVHDLYAMGFDAVLRIRHADNIKSRGDTDKSISEFKMQMAWAQGLLFVYPIWWWDRPAILKGWFDRIFQYGIAVKLQPQGYSGLFKDKRAIVFQTCGQSQDQCKQDGATEVMQGCMGAGTLELTGIHVDAIETFYEIARRHEINQPKILEKADQILNLWHKK